MIYFIKFSDKLVFIKFLFDIFMIYISNFMFYVDRFCIYMLKVVFVEIDDIIMDDVVMEIGSVNIGDSVINGK